MRRMILFVFVLLLSAPPPTEANPLCRWFGLCLYSSRGFELTVVDAETGRPLPGVYAWAEWVQYGYHGTNGPLMIQEASSGETGCLTFPAWGLRQGSRAGLELGSDPAVILFKSGYKTLLVQNDVPPEPDEFTSTRTFTKTAEAIRLAPFHGTADEWVEQLERLASPAITGRVSLEQIAQFRPQYLRRANIVLVEANGLPSMTTTVTQFKSSIEKTIMFLRSEQ